MANYPLDGVTYTTLAAAIAGMPATFTESNTITISSSINDTSTPSITNDIAGYDLLIETDSSNRATTTFESGRYYLQSTATYDTYLLTINHTTSGGRITIDGLQFEIGSDRDYQHAFNIRNDLVTLKNNHINGTDATGDYINGIYISDTDGDGFIVENCIINGCVYHGIYASTAAAGATIVNCSVYNCGADGITAPSGDAKVLNCIASGSGSNDFDIGTPASGSGYCLSGDATATFGTGCIASGNHDFVSTTSGSEDFSLNGTSGATYPLENAQDHTSDSDVPETDIDGNSRDSSSPDIGAVEGVAASGTTADVDGAVIIGGAVVAGISRTSQVSGAVVIGGAVESSSSGEETASVDGAVVIGGSVVSEAVRAAQASGAVVIGGSVVSEAIRAAQVSGAIVIGGSVATEIARVSQVSGAVVIGGAVLSTTGSVKTALVDGQIVIGGAVVSEAERAAQVSGTIIIGGGATATIARVSQVSGAIVIGGSVVCEGVTVVTYRPMYISPMQNIRTINVLGALPPS